MRYKMHETAFVGSSSNGLNDPMSSPIAMNLDRYNSRDGQSMCFHLIFIKARVLLAIGWTSRPPHRRAMRHTI